MLTDGGRRQVQLGGGGGEAFMAGRRLEGTQAAKGRISHAIKAKPNLPLAQEIADCIGV
jgi:hypothetical protein